MRALLGCLILALSAVPATSWACTPADAGRVAEVAFDDGETFDLASLTELGTEDQHYRIESQETDELFPGDQPVVIYRCHSDQRAMVKVGFSPEGQDWRSVLIALPEKMDPDAFDFSSAMGGEVTWLVERGAIAGLDLERVPAMVEGLVPGSRFFTGEATLAGQNCVTPHTCTRCGGDAVFTELPPEPLAIETAVDLEDWGGFKARFRDAATR